MFENLKESCTNFLKTPLAEWLPKNNEDAWGPAGTGAQSQPKLNVVHRTSVILTQQDELK